MNAPIASPQASLTRGQLQESPGERLRAAARRLRQVAQWLLGGLVLFVVFVWLSLPTRALAWRIGAEARKQGFLVDIADVSLSPLLDVTLHDVTWTFAPSRPDQVPSKFFASEVDVDVSIWSLLLGDVDVEVDVLRDEGHIIGHYTREKSVSRISIKIEELPLYDVPKARQSFNAPLQGLFSAALELEIPDNKMAKANGTVELTCAACRVGDGETRLYIPGSKGLKEGIPIPEIDLGTFVGKMVVEKGIARTEVPMSTESEHLSLTAEGTIKLRDPMPRSRLDLTIKVNLTEALQQQSERLRLAFQGADPKAHLEPPEQGLGYVVVGSVASPRFSAINAKSVLQSRAERRARQQQRDAKRAARNRGSSTKPTVVPESDPASEASPFGGDGADRREPPQPEDTPVPDPLQPGEPRPGDVAPGEVMPDMPAMPADGVPPEIPADQLPPGSPDGMVVEEAPSEAPPEPEPPPLQVEEIEDTPIILPDSPESGGGGE